MLSCDKIEMIVIEFLKNIVLTEKVFSQIYPKLTRQQIVFARITNII